MRDELFGLLLLGVMLVIVITLGYRPLVTTSNDLYKSVNQVHQDKNTTTRIGSDISEHGNYDNKMNVYEVLLCTQVQDSYMPEPKSLAIGDYVLEIKATHELALQSYAVAANQAIAALGGSDTDRYRVIYDAKYKQKKAFKMKEDGQVDLLESPLRPQTETLNKTVETFKIEKVG